MNLEIYEINMKLTVIKISKIAKKKKKNTWHRLRSNDTASVSVLLSTFHEK